VAWGDNVSSQIGIGTSTVRSSLAQVTSLGTGITAISASGLDTLALRSDGTVVAWGSNYFGQLGDGTTTDRATPVVVSGLSNVIAVAAGETFSLALRSDGSVVAWGSNKFGQLGNGTNTDRLTPVSVSGLTNGVIAIAAGGAHALALKSGGAVVAWGSNHFGQLGDGTSTDRNTPVQVAGLPSGVTAISAGSGHSLALTSAGGVVAWGDNDACQLGDGIFDTSVPPNPVCNNRNVPFPVKGLASGVTAISAGERHSLALTSAGAVMSWGWNITGQLGDGSTVFSQNVPKQVVGLTSGVTAISAGGLHSLALKSGGSVVAWGKNFYGELGNGATKNRNAPVAVTALTSGVTAIAAGGSHSVALQGTAGPAGAAGPAPPVFPAQPAAPIPVSASPLAPTANVSATAASQTEWAHPVLAADPAHPTHMAIAYSDQINCWLSLSTDGGATWTSKVLVGGGGLQPQSVTNPGATFGYCFNPSVAYGPNGTLFYLESSASSDFSVGNMFLTGSSDGGVTWQPLQQLDLTLPPDGSTSFAFQGTGVAVDMTSGPSGGTVYAQWDESDPFGGGGTGGAGRTRVLMDGCDPAAVSAYLSGGTLACRPPVVAGSLMDVSSAFHSIAVGSDGRVYAAWLEGGEAQVANGDSVGPYELLVSSSTDQARTFGTPVIADSVGALCPFFVCDAINTYNLPIVSVASGHDPGEVYVTVEDSRFGHARFVVSASTDGGSTWINRQGITLAGGSADDQIAPQLSVAPAGRLDVAWYEVNPDGNGTPGAGGTASQNVYVASSFDHGQTYTAPRKLNDMPSRYIDATGNLGAFGDDSSIGLVSTDSAIITAWVDNRRGNPTDPSKNDIFTSTVIAPTGPTGPPGPPGPGATPPTVSRFGVTNSVFAVGKANTPITASAAAFRGPRHKIGTTFRYTLSESATVRIVISQRLPGRKHHKACVTQTKQNRQAQRCTRVLARGTLTRTSHQGVNHVVFSGRIGSKALAPGRYQAVLTATNSAQQSSKRATVFFTVVKA
jgi:alpha-tubulin suppressor-like RCC1 family protein